jgi:hypothetical protein
MEDAFSNVPVGVENEGEGVVEEEEGVVVFDQQTTTSQNRLSYHNFTIR